VAPAGGAGPAGAKTYRCIKGYLVNGTALGNVQVWPGLPSDCVVWLEALHHLQQMLPKCGACTVLVLFWLS
jgi:hypothetical protein